LLHRKVQPDDYGEYAITLLTAARGVDKINATIKLIPSDEQVRSLRNQVIGVGAGVGVAGLLLFSGVCLVLQSRKKLAMKA